GERDTLICNVPVRARPIMTAAPTSMQIAINRLLRSFCIIRAHRWLNGEPTDRCSFYLIAAALNSIQNDSGIAPRTGRSLRARLRFGPQPIASLVVLTVRLSALIPAPDPTGLR